MEFVIPTAAPRPALMIDLRCRGSMCASQCSSINLSRADRSSNAFARPESVIFTVPERVMRQLEGARNAATTQRRRSRFNDVQKTTGQFAAKQRGNARRMGVETVFKHFVKLGSLNCPIMMSGPRCVFMLLSFIV